MQGHFTQERAEHILRHFRMFDVLGDGMIGRRQFLLAIRRSGYYANGSDMQRILDEITPNDQGLFTSAVYLDVVFKLSKNVVTEDEIVTAIKAHDKAKTGRVKTSQLAQVIATIVGDDMTAREVESLLASYGEEIDYRDFARQVMTLF